MQKKRSEDIGLGRMVFLSFVLINITTRELSISMNMWLSGEFYIKMSVLCNGVQALILNLNQFTAACDDHIIISHGKQLILFSNT